MQPTEKPKRNKFKKRGNRLGFWFFMVFIRFFGLRGTYGLLYLICLYYVFCDRAAVSAAVSYIVRRFPGCGFFRKYLHVYRLFVSQGKQLIDRYAAVLGHDVFDIQLNGYNEFLALVQDSRQGIILLTSHVGNWQVAMTALKKLGKTVYLVMNPEENPAVKKALSVGTEQGNVKIISPKQYLGGVVEIMNVLREGHIVSIMGDRRYGTQALEVSFLGDKAWFPYSAFTFALSAKCPVIILVATKVSAYQYLVDVSNILYPKYKGRQNRVKQLQPWVQKFVTVLEAFVSKHPYQCFLFHDVWQEESDSVPN